MRIDLKMAFIVTTAIALVAAVFVGLVNVQHRARIAEAEAAAATHRTDELAAEIDRLRSAVLSVPPSHRGTPGRKPDQKDRDGWPARSMRLTADRFGTEWPFRETAASVTGTLFGLCLVHVNGQTFALNGLAANSGYPPADVTIVKLNPGDPPGDLMDVAPVRAVALRIVEQLKEEHIANPYEIP